MNSNLTSELASKGYWPAVAMENLKAKKYSRTIELCTMRLRDDPEMLSGRLILARALYHSGQLDAAEEQFYMVLQKDPDNLVALKHLGDLKFHNDDHLTAFSFYSRVLQINPHTGGLSSPIEKGIPNKTGSLTMKKNKGSSDVKGGRFREILFKTETVGDLLLAQGHTRLAVEIFRDLATRTSNPRVIEKLEKTTTILKNREKKNVKGTD